MTEVKQMTSSSVKIIFDALDAYGNVVASITESPCSYYEHSRLVYTIGVRQVNGESKHQVTQTTSQTFEPGKLTFDLIVTNPEPDQEYMVHYSLYQGLLLEDGLDVKFFTTDNFQ